MCFTFGAAQEINGGDLKRSSSKKYWKSRSKDFLNITIVLVFFNEPRFTMLCYNYEIIVGNPFLKFVLLNIVSEGSGSKWSLTQTWIRTRGSETLQLITSIKTMLNIFSKSRPVAATIQVLHETRIIIMEHEIRCLLIRSHAGTETSLSRPFWSNRNRI